MRRWKYGRILKKSNKNNKQCKEEGVENIRHERY